MQRDVKSQSSSKRDIDSLKSESANPTGDIRDTNFSPRKKNSLKKKLFDDAASPSTTSFLRDNSIDRPLLLPLDMNSNSSHMGQKQRTSKQQRDQARMIEMKAQKMRKKRLQP